MLQVQYVTQKLTYGRVKWVGMQKYKWSRNFNTHSSILIVSTIYNCLVTMGLEMTGDRRNRPMFIGEVSVVLYTPTAVAVTASSPRPLIENTQSLN